MGDPTPIISALDHAGYRLTEPRRSLAAVIADQPGHFTAAGVDMPAFVAEFGPRVFHVHVKDHVGLQSVPLGAGRTDNRAVLAALRRVGYRGHLSAELEVRDRANAVRYLREALPYMTRLLAETEA